MRLKRNSTQLSDLDLKFHFLKIEMIRLDVEVSMLSSLADVFEIENDKQFLINCVNIYQNLNKEKELIFKELIKLEEYEKCHELQQIQKRMFDNVFFTTFKLPAKKLRKIKNGEPIID